MRLYLAGPMTGYPDMNFPAFHERASALRELGHDVVSPAEIDDPPDSKTWADWMRRDLVLLAGCEGVAVLPNWQASKGASLEVHIARVLDMPIICAVSYNSL